MPKYILWGVSPLGIPKCYALYVDEDEIPEYKARAEAEGWTELVRGNRAEPQLFEDSEILASASSEKPTSPPKKRASSGTSEGASAD